MDSSKFFVHYSLIQTTQKIQSKKIHTLKYETNQFFSRLQKPIRKGWVAAEVKTIFRAPLFPRERSQRR